MVFNSTFNNISNFWSPVKYFW